MGVELIYSRRGLPCNTPASGRRDRQQLQQPGVERPASRCEAKNAVGDFDTPMSSYATGKWPSDFTVTSPAGTPGSVSTPLRLPDGDLPRWMELKADSRGCWLLSGEAAPFAVDRAGRSFLTSTWGSSCAPPYFDRWGWTQTAVAARGGRAAASSELHPSSPDR